MLLVGGMRADGVEALLRARSIPCVTTCHHDPSAAVPSIGWDNVAAAERIAGYLLDIGHRHFGVIAGLSAENDRAADRIAGFRNAIERRGASLPDSFVLERPYTVAEGRAAMAALLRRPKPPTAVLCGMAAHCRPGITTLHVPAFELGDRAAGILLDAIGGRDVEVAVEHVGYDLELIVRGTTAPPEAARRDTRKSAARRDSRRPPAVLEDA
jgi:LacI family transcriptional regulator